MNDVSGRTQSYLLPERAAPLAQPTGLDAPYWDAVRSEELRVQRCHRCRAWQWGPEWICRSCHSFDVGWDEVPKPDSRYGGRIYSWERVWHATHPRLVDHVPYLVLLVEMPTAGNIRLLGNLLGDPQQDVRIGATVSVVFEHHESYSLVHWTQFS
jgi:uncharacterized protein